MRKLALLLIATLIIGGSGVAQNTPGTVTFTVTTVSNGGEYAPKHILAIWIKNASGTFIRTSKLQAVKETKYLYQWKASSSLNTVDATTGATLSSHQTHSVTWNCKNLSNAVVPDGSYEFWVEFTDLDAQGPYTHYAFNKSTTSVNTTYPNQSKFINASLTYTPQPVAVEEVVVEKKVEVTCQGNVFTFKVPGVHQGQGRLAVFNLQGQLLCDAAAPSTPGEETIFTWEADRTRSVYMYRITVGDALYFGKITHAL